MYIRFQAETLKTKMKLIATYICNLEKHSNKEQPKYTHLIKSIIFLYVLFISVILVQEKARNKGLIFLMIT